ncbi:MAG TPA: PEP-CTERM sorting domain-containing protein, partial [Roseiarcus sp.]
GEIGISIEYGSAALLGIPSSELPDVQIVRIANGQDSLLPTTFTSPDFLTADYVPFANAVGSDQFGEFGLVIAVPEASTWSMLLAAGAMLVVARGLRRRPAYARRS